MQTIKIPVFSKAFTTVHRLRNAFLLLFGLLLPIALLVFSTDSETGRAAGYFGLTLIALLIIGLVLWGAGMIMQPHIILDPASVIALQVNLSSDKGQRNKASTYQYAGNTVTIQEKGSENTKTWEVSNRTVAKLLRSPLQVSPKEVKHGTALLDHSGAEVLDFIVDMGD